MDIDYLFISLVIIAAVGVLGLLLTLWKSRTPRQKLSLEENEHETVLEDTYSSNDSSQEDEYTPSENYQPNDDIFTMHKNDRIEPTIGDPTLASLGFSTLETVLTEPETVSVAPILETNTTTTTEKQSVQINRELIILYVIAPLGHPYVGYELLQALADAGLRYGDMNIFHYYDDHTHQNIFSLASAVEPGIFDLTDMGGITCPGMCMFMSPQNVDDPSSTFDLMLETAQQLIDDLGGTLCDENRQPLTEKMLEEYRTSLTIHI